MSLPEPQRQHPNPNQAPVNSNTSRTVVFGRPDPNQPLYSRVQLVQIFKNMCIDFDEPTLKEQSLTSINNHSTIIPIEFSAPRPEPEELYAQQKAQDAITSPITASTTVQNYNIVLAAKALAPLSLPLEWRRQSNTERHQQQQQQQQQQQNQVITPAPIPTSSLPQPQSLLPAPNAINQIGGLPQPTTLLGHVHPPQFERFDHISPHHQSPDPFMQHGGPHGFGFNPYFAPMGMMGHPLQPQPQDHHHQQQQQQLDQNNNQSNQWGRLPPPPMMGIQPHPPMLFFNLYEQFTDPLQQIWYYLDSSRTAQGPFSSNDMSQWHMQGYITDVLEVRFEGVPPIGGQLIQTPYIPLCQWFLHGKSAFLPKVPDGYLQMAQQHGMFYGMRQPQYGQNDMYENNNFERQQQQQFNQLPTPQYQHHQAAPIAPQPTSFLQAVGGSNNNSADVTNDKTLSNLATTHLPVSSQSIDYDDIDESNDNDNDDDDDDGYGNDLFNDTLGFIPDDDIDEFYPTNDHAQLTYTVSFHKQAAGLDSIEQNNNDVDGNQGSDNVNNNNKTPESTNNNNNNIVQTPEVTTTKKNQGNNPSASAPISAPVKMGWGVIPTPPPTKSFSEIQREQANEQHRNKQYRQDESTNVPTVVQSSTSANATVNPPTTYVEKLAPVADDDDDDYTEEDDGDDEEAEPVQQSSNIIETKRGWGAIQTTQSTISFDAKSQKSIPLASSSGWAKAASQASDTTPSNEPVTVVSSQTARPATTVLAAASVSGKATHAIKTNNQGSAWGKPVTTTAPATPAKKTTPVTVAPSTPAPAPVVAPHTPAKTVPVKEEVAVQGPKPMSADFKKWFSGELKKMVGAVDISAFEWVWEVQDNKLCREMLIDAFNNSSFADEFIRRRDVDMKSNKSSTSSANTNAAQQTPSKKHDVWLTMDDGRSAAKKDTTTQTIPKKQQQNKAVENNAFAALSKTKLSNQQITQSKKRK